MKTFLGFSSGLFTGIFAGIAIIWWVMIDNKIVRDAVYEISGGTIDKTE